MKRIEEPDNRKRFTWEEINEILWSHAREFEDVSGFIITVSAKFLLLSKGYCIHGDNPDDCPDCRH